VYFLFNNTSNNALDVEVGGSFGGDEGGDGAEAEPERDEPETAGIGPRDVVIGAVR
jgi:hypothetical protein